jgi:uncharacterized membrane protein HdeD (DUF308 family)
MSFPNPLSGPQDEWRTELSKAGERLRERWGWIVSFGVLVALLGLAALVLVVSATIASVYTIAIFMIIAGGAEIATGFSSKTWGQFFLFIIAGLLYVVGGAFALAQPLLAAAVFTLLLGTSLIVTGLVRIYFGTRLEHDSQSLVILAGVVTALVGLLIVLGWPANSFFILGILLGLDLLFWGTSWVIFGWQLGRLGHSSN